MMYNQVDIHSNIVCAQLDQGMAWRDKKKYTQE